MAIPKVGLFYRVKLSTGKEFEAIVYTRNNSNIEPDLNNVAFSIIGINYAEAKALTEGGVTSINVKHCRPIGPPDYISEPNIFQEDILENYGINASIELYYDTGYTIRFFKITDAVVKQAEQQAELLAESDTLIGLYEGLSV